MGTHDFAGGVFIVDPFVSFVVLGAVTSWLPADAFFVLVRELERVFFG